MTTSAYIHIPFCDTLCYYCDFCKVLNYQKFVDSYLNSLNAEISNIYEGERLKTLYVGGGTPSSLNLQQLEKLLEILSLFNLDDDAEVTFEMNVESTSKSKIEKLYKFGVNRISYGVQTFNDNLLKTINRKHSSDDVYNIVEITKKVGIKNINIDLMFNLPGENIDILKNDLDNFIELNVDHLSIYGLILEEKSVFYNKGIEVDDSLFDDMYIMIKEYMEFNEYIHYETSNFAKKNMESKHNLVYWNCDEYYGFGLGAHSYVDNNRCYNTHSITEYLRQGNISKCDNINARAQMQEFMFLGLRKISGIEVNEFIKKFGESPFDCFDFNEIDENLLYRDKKNIRLTKKGLIYANDVLIHFVD